MLTVEKAQVKTHESRFIKLNQHDTSIHFNSVDPTSAFMSMTFSIGFLKND